MADIVHVNPKGSWKKVKIDPNRFPKADLEGLISLEELTDYDIVKITAESGTETSLKKNKKKEKLKSTEQITEGETQPKKKRKKKKKKKENKAQSDPQNSSTEEMNLDRTKKENHETDSGSEIKLDKKEIKKKERKKMMKQKKNKEKELLEVQGQEIIDVAEEIGKLSSPHESVKKKRKHTDSSEEPSPKKKQRWDKVRPKELVDENDSVKGMEAWKDLFVPLPVLRALKENRFFDPTPIQSQVLPPTIRDKLDILGAAETGSGKTLAFGIPLIHYILEEKRQLDSQSLSDSGTGLEEICDELVDNVDSDNDSDNETSLDEMDNDDDEEEEDNDNSASDTEDDNIVSEIDIDNVVASDNGDDDEDGSSSEDEQVEELGEDEKGCVRVIKDIDFSWLTPETVMLTKPARTHPLGLILEPTRELAIQVKNHLLAAAKYTDISVAVIVGGMSVQKQKRVLKKCPDIIVATPGRLWELVQEGEVYLSRIEETKHLVVDEADRMVEKGHFEELSKLLLRMNVDEKLRNKRHTYVFSATLTLLHSGPQRMMKKKKKIKLDEKQKLELLMKNIGLKEKAKVIDLTRKIGTVETLTEARINCSKEEKDIFLYYFLKQYPGRTLVFTNSKDCIRRLVSIFTLLQCNPLPLHADMHQRQRLKNLDRFSGNANSLLLASDVAARGLDIPNVEHVIHYQVPHTVENYIHRSGRTARASKEGLSVVLIGPQDVKDYKKIMHTLNKSEDLPMFPVDQEYLSEVKKRVSMVRQIETQEYRFNKKKHQNDWFRKAADEIGVDIEDENLLHDLGDEGEQASHKQYINRMKAELEFLLRQPILPRTFGSKYPTKSGKLATLPQKEVEKDAIKQVKKDKKIQDRMKARDALRPQLAKPMKPKKNKWKKKKKH